MRIKWPRQLEQQHSCLSRQAADSIQFYYLGMGFIAKPNEVNDTFKDTSDDDDVTLVREVKIFMFQNQFISNLVLPPSHARLCG